MSAGLRETIVALRREGQSLNAIARRLGVTRGVVAGVCNRAGLCDPARRSPHLTRAQRRRLSQDAALARKLGASQRAAARALGVSTKTLARAAGWRAAGAEARP